MLHESSDVKRIKASIQRGRFQRNLKTAIILLVASSGALFGQSVFAVTVTGTLASLFVASKLKDINKTEK